GRRRVQRHALPVHLDLAVVEGQGAAQRLDQRGLACAVVAEQREHLARTYLDVDGVESDDGAEPLRGAAHGEERRHPARSARASRTRVSTEPRMTSASTASRTTTPIAISW